MARPMPNAEPKPVEIALMIVAEPGDNTVLLKKSPVNYYLNLLNLLNIYILSLNQMIYI